MTLAQIEYLGGIEHKEYQDPEYLTLTGSATIASFKSELKNLSILIDYGAFQGGRDDQNANTLVDNRALETDCMVLTHAHLDHSGRVPLLVKNGYDKPIYMTDITAQKIYVMLEDYIKIMEEENKSATNRYKKIQNQAKYFLYAIDAVKKLESNNLSKNERINISTQLNHFFGENYVLSEILKQAETFQSEYGIYTNEDIQKKYDEIPVVLYDRKDLADTMKLARVLDYGESTDLNNTYFIDEYSEENLKKIIKKIYAGHKDPIYIDSSVFPQFSFALNERIETTKSAEKENIRIKQKNQQVDKSYKVFREKIEEMLNLLEDTDEAEAKELHSKYKIELDKEGINSQEDLENFINKQKEKLYDIKYSSTLLKQLKQSLVMKVKTGMEKNQVLMKSLQMQLIDAGHIEGSAQALFTVVTEKVNKILETTTKPINPLDVFSKKSVEHKNFLFTGDLGRKKQPNISGSPEESPYKLDFLQIETTYAGRNHPDRIEEEKKFMETIQEAKGKVIIPAFSMQRTQEVTILMLEMMEDNISDLELLKEYKERLTDFKAQLEKIIDKESKVAEYYQKNITFIQNEIYNLKRTSPIFWNIILNSPLGAKITSIYMANIADKYSLLNPDRQIKLFGRVVVHELNSSDQINNLYTPERRNRKEILVSSSGMCTGGFIQQHLLENLENPMSTILFTGYCPPNSPGGRIKERKAVYIGNNLKNPTCKIYDNKGFSGHLDHEEILMYIEELKTAGKLAKNATIVLNHGGEKRELVKADILEDILKTKRNVQVLIPELGDTVKIKC